MGRITAGMTHEIKNVLAVIKESAGLMGDILSIGQETPFLHRERFMKILDTIKEQVHRGSELAVQLNRFAHCADTPFVAVNLNELLQHFCCLMQRHARLKHVELKVLPHEPGLTVNTDPFRLQLLLSSCIDSCLKQLDGGGTIVLHPESSNGSVDVQIWLEANTIQEGEESDRAETLGEDFSELEDIQSHLGARISPLRGSGHRGFLLGLALRK